MSEMTRRERKKHDTYLKIFSSAMQLFRKQGFDATSVEQITQHADVGKGTFYNYFSSKEAVILEFSRQAYQKIITSGRESSHYSTRERLESLLTGWADFMIKDRDIAWITVRSREGAEFDLGLHYGIEGILTLGQREGDISRQFDPTFLAESLEGMMIQHFMNWYIRGEGDLHNEMKHILSIFMDGLTIREKNA